MQTRGRGHREDASGRIVKEKRIVDELLLSEIRGQPCLVCRSTQTDPCHIQTRGAGGDDILSNVVAMCRAHHTLQHSLGWVGFIDRFPHILIVLRVLGWEVLEEVGRRKLIYVGDEKAGG